MKVQSTKDLKLKRGRSHVVNSPRPSMLALVSIEAMTEGQINTRDIPEQQDWGGAPRGVFYRLQKKIELA